MEEKDSSKNERQDKPQEKHFLSSEAGGFISEADILYYKGMGQRCDEIQEIMGRNPGWLRKWGMAILGTVTAGFLCLVWFLRVPETVDVVLHTRGAGQELPVVATHSGTVVKLNVGNGSKVSRGDTALIISDGVEETALTAPQSGTVGLTAPLMPGGIIAAGTTPLHICGVGTPHKTPVYGYLSVRDAGRVSPGEEVYLDNGERGVVGNISPVAHDSGGYYFEITLPASASVKELPKELTGKIRISDERLVTKLWRSWRKR